MRYSDVESMSTKELSDSLYDWHCGMKNAFSNAEYPSDYPRSSSPSSYRLNGNHLCFTEFKKYCNKVGVYVE